MYLVFVGKNTFLHMTRKGSIHWSVMEMPESNYDLHKPKPKEVVEQTSSPAKLGCKTLNSLQVGLIDKKSTWAVRREYQKLILLQNPKRKHHLLSQNMASCRLNIMAYLSIENVIGR